MFFHKPVLMVKKQIFVVRPATKNYFSEWLDLFNETQKELPVARYKRSSLSHATCSRQFTTNSAHHSSYLMSSRFLSHLSSASITLEFPSLSVAIVNHSLSSASLM